VAREVGLYLEAASVTAAVAVCKARPAGLVAADDRVVIIGSSTGLKDVGATAARLPEVPMIEPSVGALDEALAARPAR
jgi:threonine synthase